ncbi:MAG: bifunctional diguanylate cyclase/phosphodiesterase [Acidobacteria bacterium]|nr:bifunctional diguanylate cyclase/phosphodiesterase [Acidobacteriota bacterium]
MTREFTNNFYKLSIALLGGVCLLAASLHLDPAVISWKFGILFLFTVLIAPRLSLTLPRSKFILNFSDSMVFLTFLLFGGEAAILIAAAEMLANCLYFKFRGVEFARFTLAFNVGTMALATGITYFVWNVAKLFIKFGPDSAATTQIITKLAILAFSQFVFSSLFASVYYSLKNRVSPWQAWKKEGFSISVTHFAGAGLAGIVFKLLNYADTYSIVISLIASIVIYYNYRQIISEMTTSIEQAEQAERDKTEAEREKRIEIEKYADELALSLKKEADTGNALRKSQRAFQHAALHDSLTKLPNRAYFGELVRELIAEAKKGENPKSYILFLDLVRFKTINDSLGHTIGDKVLMVVSKRFSRMLRATDRVARLGGDEFAIILRGLSSDDKAEKVAWKIHQKIAQPFSLSKNRIYTGVNIGIAPLAADYETPEEILRDADIAMHDAKVKGSGVAFFNRELREKFIAQATLEAELPFAIERRELSMHYQPLVSLRDGSLVGFEALLRWNHHRLGFISPAEFIPIAENTGQIIPITKWILGETCQQLEKWQKFAAHPDGLVVSVNISGKHLSTFGLVEDVKKALKKSGLPPSALKLEITESAAMENAVQTIQILTSLKELGVQLSIDDFGTGYSSLSYLHRLPFDTLKIDRSFVNSVGENGEDSEILQTIISLAKNLRMGVIAEGIETESQLGILKNLGCDYGQGYLMSRPLPKDPMEELLHKKTYWLPAPPEDENNDGRESRRRDKTAALV